MVVTEPGMVMLVTGVPFKYKVLSLFRIELFEIDPNVILHHAPISLMYIEVRFGQSSNILVPMLVMPLPIVARVRELHP